MDKLGKEPVEWEPIEEPDSQELEAEFGGVVEHSPLALPKAKITEGINLVMSLGVSSRIVRLAFLIALSLIAAAVKIFDG